MASGKLSPRQKMINLMYLIFIAMLAIQIGPEVLSSFGYMNEKLTDSNATATEKNKAILDNLRTKSQEQPEKYADLYSTANAVNDASVGFETYLEDLKTQFLSDMEDKTDYESMSKTELDEYFFAGDGYTPEGQAYVSAIDKYREDIVGLIGEDHPLSARIRERFSTADQETEDGLQPWLNNRYQGFPLISTVTNLTAMQSDIKTTQSEIYSTLLGGQLESDVSMSNYQTILIPDKPAFVEGENFTGRVVLGRYDASLKPSKVVVNGTEVTEFQDGGAVLNFNAGNAGDHDVIGELTFIENGEEIKIPINSKYHVISLPNSAVISADKMNVVYRGVDNPMTISIPGVSDDKIVARATGLNRVSGSSYVMKPGQGREVSISVSGTLQDGTAVTSPPKVFRIKDIPSPRGSVRKEMGYVKMPKTTLDRVTVGAEFPDFDFDLNLRVTGFTIKVPGQSAIVVSGDKMDAAAKRAIARSKRGDIVAIFDIKSTLVGNSSYNIKDAAAVSIEIQ